MQDSLRFMTCGSVDDGKSTLIGRILWESKHVFEDHLATLKKDSLRYGTRGDALDLALLVDGLQAEREQRITIDVAYRFFATPRRRFVVADTPGHEQFTRNMATAASTCELAVLVVNASKGLTEQTYRHARITALMGIRHIVMAVNKMDLVWWNEAVFAQIVDQTESLAHELGFYSFLPIPVSALNGDNITVNSLSAPWYAGPPLLGYLEAIDVSSGPDTQSFRMAVQLVNRPSQHFRGYCGRVASGEVKVGDRVSIVPGGKETRVRSLFGFRTELRSASQGDSIMLCLEDDIDVSRGHVIASAVDPIEESDQFEAYLICLSDRSIIAGRTYLLNIHTCRAVVTITSIKYLVDVTSGSYVGAKSLNSNDIAVVNLATDRPVPFEAYKRCRALGSFVLVDRFSNETIGAGMIKIALCRAVNIHWQALHIDRTARADQKLQKPVCLWLTGLSGAGKSTIADLLERRLFAAGKHTYIIDGDNIRHGLNRDLGFTEPDRVENVRRVIEVARLMVDAGLITIVSLISPYRAERSVARSLFEPDGFIEIFVDTPLAECERRDPKGLYAKARRGELTNFTGIDSPYEAPESPEIHLDTTAHSVEECVDCILSVLDQRLPRRTLVSSRLR